MSTISTAYDKIVSELTALFPSHRRLTNPYEPAENIERFLEQGWGLATSSALNTERQLSCRLSVRRSFQILLTRKFFALETDIENKSDTEKLLLEDHFSLVEHFEKFGDHDLEGLVTSFKYISDGGIEFVFTGKDQFLLMNSIYEMEYFETIV